MRGAPERGAAVVEFVLITPVLVVLMLFVVGLGRFGVAQGDVNGAARDAARAASIARSADDASGAGTAAAASALAGQVPCQSLDVVVDTANFKPGGFVKAEVTCVVELRDVSQFWTPGSVTMHGSFVAAVDVYRGVRP